MLAIEFPCAMPIPQTIALLRTFEVILVDHNTHAATPAIFKTAHNASATVDLYISYEADHFTGQQNREVDQRANGNVGVHREEHAISGDVLGLRVVSSSLPLHRNWQMNGKARR